MPISRYIVVGEEGGVALSFGEAGLAQCRKEPLLVRCSAEWAGSIQLVQLIELERTNQLPMASDPMRVEGLRDRETNPCDLAIHDDVVHSIAGSSTRFLYLCSPGIHREFADRELEVTVPKSGERWMSSRPSVQAAPGCMPRPSRLR
jgi:hypothetical protein